MNVLITDVTEMRAGNYCVAGWDAIAQRMIRPLPNGGNWTAGLLEQHGIAPGMAINVIPSQQPTGNFPHLTEDMPVHLAGIRATGKQLVDWLGREAPPMAPSLEEGFGGQLRWNSEWNRVRQSVYVPAGAQCRSLIAIRIARTALSLEEEFDKLRAMVHDGVQRYKLTVSSRRLKEAWRQGGLAAARSALPARLAVGRVGLARPFGNPPDKCYLMLNGVL